MHVHFRSVIMRLSFQLFCSFCATFTFNLLLSASTSQGFIDRPGQVDFGTFEVCVANYIIYLCIVLVHYNFIPLTLNISVTGVNAFVYILIRLNISLKFF